MADDQDPEQKTEDPSHKRLEDSRKKGQVVTSREVTSFLLLMALALIVGSFVPMMLEKSRILLYPLIEKPDLLTADRAGLGDILSRLTYGAISVALIPLCIAFFVCVFASYLQHGHLWTAESMVPKLERISPLKGFKRLVSMKSLVEFLKGVVKISIVAVAIWFAVQDDFAMLKSLPNHSIETILAYLMSLITKLLIAVCIAMFFIAALDYAYQRHEYMKNLRMTKQEVKDEYKQQEGDPKIKQRLRQIRADRARNRMMAAVPESDVIITNPTHFSIALKYDSTKMRAPVVVAKGVDYLALTIRKIAEENNIPMVQNPPLARALYASVDVDGEIPVAHYKAVAEVISYIYKLKGKAPKKRFAG